MLYVYTTLVQSEKEKRKRYMMKETLMVTYTGMGGEKRRHGSEK